MLRNDNLPLPSREEFEKLYTTLSHGVPLNLSMLGNVFGQEFWKLIVLVQTNINVKGDKLEINIYDSVEWKKSQRAKLDVC